MQKSELNPESKHLLEIYIKKKKRNSKEIKLMIEYLYDGMARPYISRLKKRKEE